MLDRLDIKHTHMMEMEEATAAYVEQLDQEAVSYLRGRGLEADAHLYRIGRAIDPMPGHQQYAGRLVIPYLTPAGVVSLRFRSLDPNERAKMLGLPGAQPRMYNVAALHSGLPYVAICEGEFDAMAMTSIAGIPAVGIAGASMWFKHFPRCFADFENVYVVCDNDVKEPTRNEAGEEVPAANPGQDLARKIVTSLHGNARNIVPPPNLDVNDWLLRDGPELMRAEMGV